MFILKKSKNFAMIFICMACIFCGALCLSIGGSAQTNGTDTDFRVALCYVSDEKFREEYEGDVTSEKAMRITANGDYEISYVVKRDTENIYALSLDTNLYKGSEVTIRGNSLKVTSPDGKSSSIYGATTKWGYKDNDDSKAYRCIVRDKAANVDAFVQKNPVSAGCTITFSFRVSGSAERDINMPSPTPHVENSGKVSMSDRKEQNITAKNKIKTVYGAKDFQIDAQTDGNGNLSYESSEPKIVQVSDTGVVKIKGCGKAVITVNANETLEYGAAQKKITVIVLPKKVSVKEASSPSKGTLLYEWKKDSQVEGYQIMLSRKSQNNSNEFSKKKGSIKIGGLKSGSTYKIKIRGYIKIEKKRQFGAWSRVYSVKIK